MTAHKSDQMTKRAAGQLLKTNEATGTRRVAFFKFTVPTATAAIGDTIDLVTLPKGARILGGTYANEAMTSGGAAATIALGDGTTADKFLGATSVDAAGKGTFADTVALGFGTELAVDTTIVATVSVEALAAGKILMGAVEYVVD